ncbi:MAG TPA: sterol desaturase family protein [Chitinophagales bacterium]|nr:sterol desaturase family protein [Chitinophagales bacterium]
MIETLNHLQPILIIVSLTFFFSLESFIPDVTEFRNRKKHTLRNLVLSLLCFIANGIGATWLTYWMLFIQQHELGLLNALHINAVTAAVAGVLLVDLDSYILHRLAHRIPVMWRLHRVHHSDNQLDSTSSLRVHPLEVMLQITWRSITYALLGIPVPSFIIFSTLMLPLLFIQHANIRFPKKAESILSFVFVTSSWHRVHHSDEQPYTDSHYGNLFTFWDRIFKTYNSKVPASRLKFGLKGLKEDTAQTIKSQLLLPFRKVKREV